MEIILIAIAIVWLYIAYKEYASDDFRQDLFVGLFVWSAFGILPLVAIWGIYKFVVYYFL